LKAYLSLSIDLKDEFSDTLKDPNIS